MVTCARIGCGLRIATWVLAATVVAAPAAAGGLRGAAKFNPDHETVDVFTAIEDGRLEAKLIPCDSRQCNLLIKNLSDKPLNVTLPDVLAAVPVLAQFNNNQFNNDPFNNNQLDNNAQNNNAPQTLGIGNPFGNQPGNQFGNQPGNQFGNQRNPNMMNRRQQLLNLPGVNRRNNGPAFAPFNVAPEKTARLTVPSVCLEHGKKEPRPSMAYTIKPIDTVTDKAEAHEICRMLGHGEIDQRVAQAAAWHLANDMPWDKLAAKRIRVLGYGKKPYFTAGQLAQAKDAVGEAYAAAGERKRPVLAKADVAPR